MNQITLADVTAYVEQQERGLPTWLYQYGLSYLDVVEGVQPMLNPLRHAIIAWLRDRE